MTIIHITSNNFLSKLFDIDQVLCSTSIFRLHKTNIVHCLSSKVLFKYINKNNITESEFYGLILSYTFQKAHDTIYVKLSHNNEIIEIDRLIYNQPILNTLCSYTESINSID